MTKPSQRHTSHVQSEKPDAAQRQPGPVAPAPPEPAPIVSDDKTRGPYWFALVIWTFVCGFLFVWSLVDLIVSLFRH